ncbi:unnamed protein product [Closterium sp. Naga37s-1]|nr:unnamed protein product [Closterium sp. Naga37s-1]
MHSSMTAQTPVTAPHATGSATSAASSAMSASSSSTAASSLLAAMETGGSCPVPGGIKTQYRRTKDFVLLSWRTPDFEIMAAFDPLATKPAIAVCNAICPMLQWPSLLSTLICFFCSLHPLKSLSPPPRVPRFLCVQKPAIADCNAICHMLQQLESELSAPTAISHSLPVVLLSTPNPPSLIPVCSEAGNRSVQRHLPHAAASRVRALSLPLPVLIRFLSCSLYPFQPPLLLPSILFCIQKPAIAVCNAICHMLQQLESELFLPGSVIF